MSKMILAAVTLVALSAPADAGNLVKNGGFSQGVDPWWKTPMELKMGFGTGEMCMAVPAGTAELWDVIVGQNDVPLTQGAPYTLTFKARSNPPGLVRALVQMPVKPWTPYASLDQQLTDTQTTYSIDFTPGDSRKDAQVAFQVGGAAESWLLCLDDVTLTRK